MNFVQIPREKLEWITKECNQVHGLTVEVEKVLNWYRDHPHYPLDYDKVREKIMEAHTRIEGIATILNELRQPKAQQNVEDTATDVWL